MASRSLTTAEQGWSLAPRRSDRATGAGLKAVYTSTGMSPVRSRTAAAVVVAGVICGGCPSGGRQIAPEYSAPTPPSEPRQSETGGAALHRECEAGQARSCSVLASAYDDGDSVLAPEVRRDSRTAVLYRLKACSLGAGSDCARVGDAFAEGKGVQPNLADAAKFYKLSCDDRDVVENTLVGFSCWKLGKVLLKIDYLANYDEAMTALDRGCALQSSTCSTKEFHQGTGLIPSQSPPKGAVGYSFGITAKEAARVCAQQGGRFDPKRDPTICIQPTLDALNSQARYVGLDFCKHDALCSIGVSLKLPASDVLGEYSAIKNKLVGLYGKPSSIVVKTSPECRTFDALADCIESKRAQFLTRWIWNERGALNVYVAAAQGSTGIVLGYDNDDRIKAIGTPGL